MDPRAFALKHHKDDYPLKENADKDHGERKSTVRGRENLYFSTQIQNVRLKRVLDKQAK